MRKALSATLILALGSLFLGSAQPPQLVVYTYDSFTSWGPAAFIEEEFEKQNEVDVEFVATGPSREMLSRLLTEREAGGTPADVFMGELNDIPRAREFGLFQPLTAVDVPNLQFVPEELLIDPQSTLVPYEHGYVTLVYDSQALSPQELPKTFLQLLLPKYRKKLIVQDPRTSSVGHAFLFWTIHEFGEDFPTYWHLLLPNLLSVFPGWSAAYEAFQRGEAPLAVSFSTDACFNSRYQPLLLQGQGYRTVFGAGVIKGTDYPQLAKAFIDFLLSIEVQEKLPVTEVMFPANSQAVLPEDWESCAIVPSNPVMLPLDRVAESNDRWLETWAEVVVGGR